MINISYNIACQWHKKLWAYMEGMPSRFHIPCDSMTIRFFVPKFHLKAHIDEYGEAPERGRTLLCKIRNAIKWKKEHEEGLAELERTIQPMLVLQWRKKVEAWEEDNSQPNPFESRYASITQAAVHLQLAELEAHELQVGINVFLHTDISPSRLITAGIDLQDQQQRLKTDIANASLHSTDKQKTTLRHQSSEAGTTNMAQLKPEAFKLWLPSELQPTVGCDNRLAAHKWDLWHAQALDALNEVCSHLCLQSHMYIYKDRNALIEGMEVRKCASVDKYRSGWDISLPPLLDSQVRPMGDMERQVTGWTHMWTIVAQKMSEFRILFEWSGAKHAHVQTAGCAASVSRGLLSGPMERCADVSTVKMNLPLTHGLSCTVDTSPMYRH
ncbi:uncharacterized protein HD556DRAFT_1310090 [Suillus plorans]|uniref:Uncharacterized protein n=1 Tax=Suillus plorans TaxID=116603 RepID=A0A9P7AKB9_9AGAM|nr:uncharacterized protein HD556DRAFT_1310090 [Suillus plorans]KAG1791220.1 hypothetical protein HD556DRAFT_1310090 [Suillus plorans]